MVFNFRYYNSWIETIEEPETNSSKCASSPSKSPSKSLQSQVAMEIQTGTRRTNHSVVQKVKTGEKIVSGSPKSYKDNDSVDWDSASDQDNYDNSEQDDSSSDELGNSDVFGCSFRYSIIACYCSKTQ